MKLRYLIEPFAVTLVLGGCLLVTANVEAQETTPSAEYDYTREAELGSRLDLDNADPDHIRSIFARRTIRASCDWGCRSPHGSPTSRS